MTKICCICNRVEHQGRWITVDVLPGTEQLTHGYCPTCFLDVMEDIGLSFEKRNAIQALAEQSAANHGVAEGCAL